MLVRNSLGASRSSNGAADRVKQLAYETNSFDLILSTLTRSCLLCLEWIRDDFEGMYVKNVGLLENGTIGSIFTGMFTQVRQSCITCARLFHFAWRVVAWFHVLQPCLFHF